MATKGSLIKFRVATNERADLEAAAQRAGLSLSEWSRRNLLAVARGPMTVANNDRGPAPVALAELAPNPGRTMIVDHDKIAAFQRKARMTVYDARKRGQK